MDKPKRVAELLDSPEKWLKGDWARNANGESCTSTSPEACAFCLQGAINFAYPDWDEREDAMSEIVAALYGRYGSYSIVGFNDHPLTTFADIRRVIEEAGV